MIVQTAKGCAWRAFYVYTGKRDEFGRVNGTQVFRLGFDPNGTASRPWIFAAIGGRKDCQGGRKGMWEIRIPLPRKWTRWTRRLDGRRKRSDKCA